MDSTHSKPPYFTGIQPRTWTPNRVYRVYVLPEEWICVYAGRADDVRMMMAAQGGLLGGVLAASMSPSKKNAIRADEIDDKSIEELRDDHKHNFAVRAENIADAELAAPSFWFRINHSTVQAIALLRLRTADGQRLTLGITTHSDLRAVQRLLPAQLGDRFVSLLSAEDDR